jgi:glutamine synthetase
VKPAGPPTELVALLYNDLSGLTRGRAFPLDQIDRRRKSGVGWVPANQGLTAFGAIAEPNPWGSVGDLRLLPDAGTEVRVDLWPDTPPVHFFLCDATEVDGSEWDSCARTLLRNALAQLADLAGASMVAAFEQEFRLTLPTDTEPAPAAFTYDALRSAEPFASTLVAALAEAGVEVETVLPEYGERQWELSSAPRPGLRAADDAVICRELVREVARRLGGRASFTPIIDPDQPGNGMHVHFSFRGPDGQSLSEDVAGRFAAGVLTHLDALCAFTAPTPISYLRLTPHRWSAGYAFAGRQNREAAIRLVPAGRGGDDHLEFRAADCAASPYLALAMLVFAGIDGIDRLAPVEVWDVDPGELSEAERAAKGVARLPDSLSRALDAAESDDYLRGCLSADLFAAYTSMKRTELSLLDGLDPGESCARYACVY